MRALRRRLATLPGRRESASLAVPDERRTGGLSRRGRGVWADDDGVRHGNDLVNWQPGAGGVRPDRVGTRRLVDADGTDLSRALGCDVAADPADVLRHLVVADLKRTFPGRLERVRRF